MASGFLRTDLSPDAPGFEQVALEPGVALLDRPGAHYRALRRWLGRFVAEPQWQGDEATFFLCDEAGNQPQGVRCEPATRDDLRGSLKTELAALQEKLRQADPASHTEKLLHALTTRCLASAGTQDPIVGGGFHAFKYRDAQAQWRVVLCHGFQPRGKAAGTQVFICPRPDCRWLQVREAGASLACPACGKSVVVLRPVGSQWKGVAIALSVLMLVGVGGAAFALWRPSATLSGRVLSKGYSTPIANAVVHVEGSPVQTQSDADGRFRLEGLPRGSGVAFAASPGFEIARAEVMLGGKNDVEFQLSGASRLSGQVVYRQGSKDVPVANAKILADAAGDKTASTDADGRFDLSGLAPGLVRISIEATGFKSQQTDGQAASENGEPLAIRLIGAGQVTGQVVFAADASLPIVGAEISLDGIDIPAQVSDAMGKFQLDDLPPEQFTVRVTAPGYLPVSLEAHAGGDPLSIPLTGDAVLTGEVRRADNNQPVANADVQASGLPVKTQTDSAGEFRLEGIPSGSTKLTATAPGFAGSLARTFTTGQNSDVAFTVHGNLTLTGRVVEASGKTPLAKVSVAIVETNLKTTTDALGRFTFAGVSPDPAKIAVSAAGFFPEQISFEPAADKSTVDDIALRPAATLIGKVTSANDGKPLASAEVTVGAEGPKAVTNSQGEFSLSPLPAGTAQISVSAAEHFPAKVSAELIVGRTSQAEITLAPLARFQGLVLRALDNAPLAGVEVTLAETNDKATTNAEGRYVFDRAPAGDASLTAIATGYEPQTWKQKLAAGTQKLADITLSGNSPAKGVTLELLDKKRAVAGVKLVVVAGDFRRELVSAKDGAFEIGKLPQGLVEITAQAPGFQDARFSKEIKPEDAWLEVPLARLLDVSGVVLDASSKKPVGKAQILVVSAMGEHQAMSAANGAFKLSGLPPGAAAASVKAPGYAPADLPIVVAAKAKSIELLVNPLLTVQGTIVSADNPRQGIAKAQIEVQVGAIVETAVTDNSGRFSLKLPAGKANVTVEAEGYSAATTSANITAASPQLSVRLSRSRTLRGMVTNAVNNKPVVGAWATVALPGGTSLSGTTDSSGAFEIKSVPVGSAEVEVSATGFESLKVAAVTSGESSLRVVLSPDLAPGEVRVVLTWGKQTNDLDAHLFGPSPGGERFHVFYDARKAHGATLDVDAKEGLGPETMTMKVRPGTYQFFVADPGNLNELDGGKIIRSNAQIRVYYKGAKANQPFVLPAVRPDTVRPSWHVFDIQVDSAGKISVAPKHLFSPNLPQK